MVVSSYGQLVSLTGPTPNRSPSRTLALFNARRLSYASLYRTQPEVRTCVEFIARNCAHLGLHAFRRVSDTDRERLANGAVESTLKRPNPSTTRYRLFESLWSDLGIYFNAFLVKVRLQPGLGLVRLPPDEVCVEGGLFPIGYQWRPQGGRPVDFAPEDIIHIAGYDPLNPILGLSPLETLRRVLAEEVAARDYRQGYYNNAARISAVIERPKDAPRWTPDQRTKFRSEWQELFVGGLAAGRAPVLEDGMTVKPMSFSPEQGQEFEHRKLRREEVAAAYHIPQPLVGILDHATFSNIKEQHKHLYSECLGPWLGCVREEFERQLLPEFHDPDEEVYLEFNLFEKLKGSFEEQAASLRQAIGRPYMTPNEGRARLNLPRSTNPDDDAIASPTYVSDPGAEQTAAQRAKRGGDGAEEPV